MKNILGTFQRLQWKLTLSYTLVTVVTIFVLALVLVVVTNQANYNTPQFGTTLTLAVQDSTPKISAFFKDPGRDKELQNWIDRTVVGNSVLFNNMDDASGNKISFAAVVSQETLIAIVDTDGRTLASNHSELKLNGRLLSSTLDIREANLLNQGLASNRNERLWYREGETIFLTAPILDDDSNILGVVFMRFILPDRFTLIWIGLLSVLPATLLVGIGAALIGTIFGALNARGLTRRLDKISRATRAWGSGDFSFRISDRASDEIKNLSDDLNHMADDLQTLVQTREDLAAVEERNRLARDLHDSVKQQVFAVRMNLGAARSLWSIQPDAALEQLNAAIGLTGQAQQELNVLIHTLRPVQIEKGGLEKALRETAEVWQRQSKIAVDCQIEEPGALPSEIENALFRVAQEALANAARHSGAQVIRLALAASDGQLCMRISDNGRGFDPAKSTPGLGLHSMNERVQALGGLFQLTSNSSGTILSVTFPRPEVKDERQP